MTTKKFSRSGPGGNRSILEIWAKRDPRSRNQVDPGNRVYREIILHKTYKNCFGNKNIKKVI